MRLLLLLVLAVAIAPPVRAQAPPLGDVDRIRLAEAFHLSAALGDTLWTGWSDVPFAVLLVTAEHEYLVRHPAPSDDFERLGYDDLLASDVYVRPHQFPPNLLATFPAVNGVPTVVVGTAEATGKLPTAWVVTLLHEHLHQVQTTQPGYYLGVNALDLSGGDTSGMWMLDYPFPYANPDIRHAIIAYRDALRSALDDPAKAFLVDATRDQLRYLLDPADDRYLAFQLWQEGVARYTELRVAEWAAAHHTPTPAFAAVAGPRPYAPLADALRDRLRRELATLDLAADRRVAFYALGAAHALLLDGAQPDWRTRYFAKPFALPADGLRR